jgi:tubulin polyglutamylase TTLL9
MTANTAEDCELKCGLLDDVLTIVDTEKLLEGQEQQVGGFDLIYSGKPVQQPPSSAFLSLLGCKNNRVKNLKKLAVSTAMRFNKNKQ